MKGRARVRPRTRFRVLNMVLSILGMVGKLKLWAQASSDLCKVRSRLRGRREMLRVTVMLG